ERARSAGARIRLTAGGSRRWPSVPRPLCIRGFPLTGLGPAPYKAPPPERPHPGEALSTSALDIVSAKLPECIAESYTDRTGAPWRVLHRDGLRPAMKLLKEEPALDFRLFVSIDAVDRLNLPEYDPRCEVVYFVRSLKLNEVVRLKVRVGEDDPTLPSITDIFQGANWWERFVWDFYGIRFTGHPDLRRILMYEEFVGHPLRKDYALRDRQPLIPEKPIRDIFRGPGTNNVT